MKSNVLVVHGGGPTPVMNASLYGVITEAKRHPEIESVYGAIGGMEGIVKEQLLDLLTFEEEKLKLLLHTPGTAIGSSRYPVTEEDYQKIPEILEKYKIRYILPNGGNGTMDTCGKIYQACVKQGYEDIKVVGIPKTIDNDIAITDHTPGYGSAARYLAASVKEVAADVASLPIHVCIIEALGRNAGWITAASALAREKEGDAPHLIYTPERPFNQEEFLEDVKKLYDKLGGVVVVVSEGLKKEDGTPIVEPIFKTDRAVYYGDVSAYLANLVVKRLGVKARSEKPGLCGRASIAWQSLIDRREAQEAGEEALRLALEGHTGVMVGIPKTIDNDIAITDHTPGYGSAARYLAASVKEVAADVASLPIHVCIIEALGRNAGWITAASALAREKEGDAPHLIYTPERPFNQEEFLEDVKKLYDKLGGVVVVVSEGLKKEDGTPIVEPIFKTDRAVYYGDVSAYLANLVVKRLGVKARSEKPGLCGRASIAWQSLIDRREAQEAGEEALRLALEGHTGVMVGIQREKTADGSYKTRWMEIPIEEVMLLEKTLPDSYINDRGNDVTEEFVSWCRPLIGEGFDKYLNFKDYWQGGNGK